MMRRIDFPLNRSIWGCCRLCFYNSVSQKKRQANNREILYTYFMLGRVGAPRSIVWKTWNGKPIAAGKAFASGTYGWPGPVARVRLFYVTLFLGVTWQGKFEPMRYIRYSACSCHRDERRRCSETNRTHLRSTRSVHIKRMNDLPDKDLCVSEDAVSGNFWNNTIRGCISFVY